MPTIDIEAVVADQRQPRRCYRPNDSRELAANRGKGVAEDRQAPEIGRPSYSFLNKCGEI
ncbi:hypothetical protein DPPLL_17910 [Desulfofustis limnaeus]|uniref:Uncharacterized protein n=1 Tax=Desulfofustis limnaeus TaxID=2740163 RepID=A0ABM7W914_9BACT|nr:hypothetical protein DPPLL_17910 [Desulfofustis limnaeus]